MTEGCITCANRPEDNKVGSIGTPFEGIEMKIAEKDGEVLIRGRNVMLGYYNNPEATAAALDEDGYYHTGDVGYEDKDGHFYITDRLKDLFKLSNGKYIAPLQVESLLKQSPLISQPVVVGSGRKQVGALIVPDWDALKDEMRSLGIETEGSREELCENVQFIKRVQQDAIDLTRELMTEVDVIVATGGMPMVKSAYSSGKPAFGASSARAPSPRAKSKESRAPMR